MQIKQQAGKLTLRVPLQQMISEQQSKNGIVLLDIRLEHVLALDGLPPYHKDPFDRLMIAQANAEGIAILSADSVFAQYPVHVLT